MSTVRGGTDDGLNENHNPLPYALTLERWNVLIRTLTRQKADSVPISGKSLEEITKIPETVTSANLKFLKYMTIITPESKGSEIKLTEIGKKYGELLIAQNIQEQNQMLSDLVRQKMSKIVDFCETQKQLGNLTFDNVFEQIKYLSKTKDVSGSPRNTDSNYSRAIYTIIDMLIITNVLDETYKPENNKAVRISENGTPKQKDTTSFELPTSCKYSWLTTLFSKIREINPPKADRNFIRVNVEGHHHEGSIFTVCKFLGISKENGDCGDNYEKLRFYGDPDFKTNLGEIIRIKYKKIFEITKLEVADKEKLVSYIMQQYKVGDDKSRRALDVLIDLCRISEIPLSSSLQEKSNNSLNIKKQTPVPNKQKQKPLSVSNPIDNNAQITQVNNPISNQSFAIEIKINIDAKDPTSFSNTFKFIQDLKNMGNSNILINVSNKPEEKMLNSA